MTGRILPDESARAIFYIIIILALEIRGDRLLESGQYLSFKQSWLFNVLLDMNYKGLANLSFFGRGGHFVFYISNIKIFWNGPQNWDGR